MLSIDAPEVHYPGKPYKYDGQLAQLAKKLKGPQFAALPARLRKDLARRLKDKAGTRQYESGLWAADHFAAMLERELHPSNRPARRLFLLTSGERFDQYGRLLVYMTKHLTKKERETLPLSKRKTFNLMMVEAGWAVPFVIYPSLPRKKDLELLRKAGELARKEKRGCWADPKVILGYEFRMCMKMARGRSKSSYLSRWCADMTNRKLYEPEHYLKVLPENRLFIWAKDVEEAEKELDLLRQ
jgi:hypothetical protein